MDARQQKIKCHDDGGAGGTRFTEYGQQQTSTAFDHARALTVDLMDQVLWSSTTTRSQTRRNRRIHPSTYGGVGGRGREAPPTRLEDFSPPAASPDM